MNKELTPVVQNEETPLQAEIPEANEVCKKAAMRIFDRVMRWNPLKEAGKLAASMIIAKCDNADFFSDKYALSEKQALLIKESVEQIFDAATNSVVLEVKDYEARREDFIGKCVIEELMKVPEETMAAIGEAINRGALLAMTALCANAKNEDFDEIIMRKSKQTGNITIPTRGVFISTNCIERIKEAVNFRNIGYKSEIGEEL